MASRSDPSPITSAKYQCGDTPPARISSSSGRAPIQRTALPRLTSDSASTRHSLTATHRARLPANACSATGGRVPSALCSDARREASGAASSRYSEGGSAPSVRAMPANSLTTGRERSSGGSAVVSQCRLRRRCRPMRVGTRASASAAAMRHCEETRTARSWRARRISRTARRKGNSLPFDVPGARSQNGSDAMTREIPGMSDATSAAYALHQTSSCAAGNRARSGPASADAKTRSPMLSRLTSRMRAGSLIGRLVSEGWPVYLGRRCAWNRPILTPIPPPCLPC